LRGGLAPEVSVKPRGKLVEPFGVEPLRMSHRDYLLTRDFDPDEIVRLWQVQGLGMMGPRHLRWRLYVPIMQNGERVSWTTRSINPETTRRYVGAKAEEEAVPKGEILYGEDYCRHSVVVCEGPTDVWRIGPGAVATLGVAFTQAQVARLSKYPVRAVCFDSDPEAQKRAKKLCDALLPYPGRTSIVTIDAKDPASMKPHEVRQIRRAFLD
jgi:DNA primase